jgi:hypothetical protein
VSDSYYQATGDVDILLNSIGQIKRLMKSTRLSISSSLYLKQAELVLEHYRDYWQAEHLCRKVLSIDGTNSEAHRFLKIIKTKLSY